MCSESARSRLCWSILKRRCGCNYAGIQAIINLLMVLSIFSEHISQLNGENNLNKLPTIHPPTFSILKSELTCTLKTNKYRVKWAKGLYSAWSHSVALCFSVNAM